MLMAGASIRLLGATLLVALIWAGVAWAMS